MYLVYYGDQFLHDAYSDDRRAYGGKLSGDVNDYLTFELTIPQTHPLRNSIKKRDYASPVVATFDDQVLFRGYVEDTQETVNLDLKIMCKGDLAILADTVVRPYTTDPGDTQGGRSYIGGQGFAYLFQWFVSQHNAHCTYRGEDGQVHGTEKQFQVRYPVGSGTSLSAEGAKLDERGDTHRSSSSKPTTLGEIQTQILDSLGAYLQLWYDGDTKCLALYADAPEGLRNNQVVEFGVNMTDYTLEDSCVDTYTAIRAEGGNDASGNQVTLSGVPDGVKSGSFYKSGDVVYHMGACATYGYREYAWSDSTATDSNTLLARSLLQLQRIMVSTQSIDVSAMDMVFVNSEYRHLLPGQLVVTQSAVHGVNLELLVSSCDVNFDSPGHTRYSMGSSATRISKSWSNIIKDIGVATDGTQRADQAAQGAQKQAATAQEAARAATEVTVRSQGAAPPDTRSARAGTGTGEVLFEPSEGVSVVSAVVAATGSVRQLHLVLRTSSVVQSMQELGTLLEPPATVSMLAGDLVGAVGTDGAVVAWEEVKADSEVEVGTVYVIGVADV